MTSYCSADWLGSPIDKQSTIGYCVFIGGSIVSWKNKKQNVDARSIDEAKYRAMPSLTCGPVWIKQFLQEVKFCEMQQMSMYCCDKQTTICIATNHIFHERTNIEIYFYFCLRDLVIKGNLHKTPRSTCRYFDKFSRGPQICS